MTIITKAGSPIKGSATQFTLDKSALAAVTSVAADSYYSDSTNWKEVSLVYKSSIGNQSETLKFDASLASPTANFAVSLKALDVFQIKKIVIKDFDGGIFEVPRSQLTTAEFDVDMSGSPTPTGYRYYKTAFYTGYANFNSSDVEYSYVVITNVQFKVNGINTNPISATFSDSGNGWNGSPADLIDNNFVTEAYCSGLQSATRSVTFDMGSSVLASDILISPRTSANNYAPNHFEVFGSNDGVTFESIACIDASSAWQSSTYRTFALSSTPVNSPYAIQWDEYNGNTIRECDGGFSGTSGSWTSANAISKASKVSTLATGFTFIMNIVSTQGLESCHGIQLAQTNWSPNITYNFLYDMLYGFNLEASGNLYISHRDANGSYPQYASLGALPNGSHELKIALESGNLNYYVDSVLKFTVNSFNPISEFPLNQSLQSGYIFPCLSNYTGGMIVTSSTMTHT